MKPKTALLTAFLASILALSPGIMAQEQLTRGYGLDRIVEINPDSPIYGLDVAIDRVIVGEGEIVEERASEMRKMQLENKEEAVSKAQENLNRTMERIRNRERITERSREALQRAEQVLEEVRANAPEAAQSGLQTALENVQNARNKPVETPSPP